jgi:hypothetical protein
LENLLSPWSLMGDKLALGLAPDVKLQMIAADDIGKFGSKAFVDADHTKNLEVDIAGDAVTMTEAAAALSPLVEALGPAVGGGAGLRGSHDAVRFDAAPVAPSRLARSDTVLARFGFRD